jgi:hypothetical protein
MVWMMESADQGARAVHEGMGVQAMPIHSVSITARHGSNAGWKATESNLLG